MTTSGLWCCAGFVCEPHKNKGRCERPKKGEADETDTLHDLHLHMIIVVSLFVGCVYAAMKYRPAITPSHVRSESYEQVEARDDAYESIDMSPISSRYQSSTA